MAVKIVQILAQKNLSFVGFRDLLCVSSGTVMLDWSTENFSAKDWTRENLVISVGMASQEAPSELSVIAFPQVLDIITDTQKSRSFGWGVDSSVVVWDAQAQVALVTIALAVKSSVSELLRIGFQITSVTPINFPNFKIVGGMVVVN